MADKTIEDVVDELSSMYNMLSEIQAALSSIDNTIDHSDHSCECSAAEGYDIFEALVAAQCVRDEVEKGTMLNKGLLRSCWEKTTTR